MEVYLTLKIIHILSSTLLFGTGLGTAFYMWRADKSGDVKNIAYTAKNVVLADWMFTTPAVIVQPVTGIAMLYLAGFSFTQLWIWVSVLLYVFIGCCWLPVVFIQIKVRDNALRAIQNGTLFNSVYHRKLMRWWYGLGWPAFISVIAIFVLMVFKV